MAKTIESMVSFVPRVEASKTIDMYDGVTAVLYTPPSRVFDLPAMGIQIHIHGSGDRMFGGDVRPLGSNDPFRRLNGYECAMFDYYANQFGLPNKKW